MKDVFSISGDKPSWGMRVILRSLILKMRHYKILNKKPLVLSISFVSGKEMTKINAKFRGKKKDTDVLSFENPAANTTKTPVVMLGDIVISIDTLKKQAKEHKHTVKKELQVLLCHGILHLLGYDHEKSKKDELKMKNLEKKILKSSGLINRVLSR